MRRWDRDFSESSGSRQRASPRTWLRQIRIRKKRFTKCASVVNAFGQWPVFCVLTRKLFTVRKMPRFAILPAGCPASGTPTFGWEAFDDLVSRTDEPRAICCISGNARRRASRRYKASGRATFLDRKGSPRRVYAEKPREFVRRIRVYWQTWQAEIPAPKDAENNALIPH
jgi:hypothetical protein